jgi:WhiB family redox-sensing transcriptional regulator
MDTETFFPLPGRSGETTKAAIKVCRACPVITECLRWALEERELHGIWGGMTQEERAAMMRRGARTRQWPQHTADAIRRMHLEGHSDGEIAKFLALPSRAAVFKWRSRHMPETVAVSC